jgi:hypothetical protein
VTSTRTNLVLVVLVVVVMCISVSAVVAWFVRGRDVAELQRQNEALEEALDEQEVVLDYMQCVEPIEAELWGRIGESFADLLVYPPGDPRRAPASERAEEIRATAVRLRGEC